MTTDREPQIDTSQVKLWEGFFDYYDAEYLNTPYRPKEDFIRMLADKYTIYPVSDLVHIPRVQIEKMLEQIIDLNVQIAELQQQI